MSPPPDTLDESTVDPDPFTQFDRWYADAQVATDDKAGAMTVATATADGRPSARVVLLRGIDERGFVFYTSYDSRKAEELDTNPQAAALFYWPELDRQIRIEGPVTRVDRAESEAYFASRPRGHQLSAWSSPQSAPIEDRAFLEARLADAEARFADDPDIPLPDSWGGYRLHPELFEFWVNRTDRLHDRIRYRRAGPGWVIDRLAP
jgi:pyridoxamine 5'-phosphate oxidase